jgi:hypothetical protein
VRERHGERERESERKREREREKDRETGRTDKGGPQAISSRTKRKKKKQGVPTKAGH